MHAKEAGLKKVVCNVLELDDHETLVASFSENEFKEGLTPYEKALAVAVIGGYDELILKEMGDLRVLAKKEGRKTASQVATMLGYDSEAAIRSLLEPLRIQKDIYDMGVKKN